MRKINLPYLSLIFVAGGPSTGKTTILEQVISKINNVVLIDKDDISDTFLRTPDTSAGHFTVEWYKLDGPRRSIRSAYYRDHVGLHTYGAMLEQAATNLRLGVNPFLQGNYTSQIKESYFQKIVEPFLNDNNLDCKTKLLFCHAPDELIAERIRKRNFPRDAAKLKSPEAMQEYLDSQDFLPQELEILDHVKLDSSFSLENCVEKAMEYLQRK